MKRFWLLLLILGFFAPFVLAQDIRPIPRRLPPANGKLEPAEREAFTTRLAELKSGFARFQNAPHAEDVAVLLKAVEWALEHTEFYDAKKDPPKAAWALKTAEERLAHLKSAPWRKTPGLVVRGFRSAIDGSVQPYGLVIPEKLPAGKVPLYVWLHGRGDTQTDLHFLHQRAHSVGEIKPDGFIVLHPFGRHCVGFKHAGEIDVMEAIDHVVREYSIDPDRIALMGFSMGGAGSWHLGAHYTDRFAAIHAGAGFAETARYINLKKEDYPPEYEQILWGVYDVPGYVRNLFNRPVIAYSGEKDKQIQAARVMEEAFAAHGRKLPHVIGPDTEHKYHPDSLKEVLAFVGEAVRKGRPQAPEQVSWQGRTLRYPRLDWVEVLGLQAHWQDSRVDAEARGANLQVKTSQITALKLTWPRLKRGTSIDIDGQKLTADGRETVLVRESGVWKIADEKSLDSGLRKKHGLQGPIDDAFMAPFVVVGPDRAPANVRLARWVKFSQAHFAARWKALMRGDLPVRSAAEITDADLQDKNLILWGDAASNPLIARVLEKLPLKWSPVALELGGKSWPADQHVPVLIYPNPLNPQRYVVLNSGLTFREAHDRTNSLQNPKLPDWAVIDLTQDPDENAPGRVTSAGFFDENWK